MKKMYVWDPAVRVFHWGVGGLVLAAFLTADEDEWIPVHVKIGLVVLGAVVFRLAWGLWGSSPARFGAFVRAPREVLAYARAYVRGRPPLHTSHNPIGALMVVTLLGVLLGTTVTGLLLYSGPGWGGSLAGLMSERTAHGIEELHEGLASALVWLIGLHIAGVIVSSILERQNLVAGMITGYKRGAEPAPAAASPARVAAGLLGAALLGYAVVRVAMALVPVAEAQAAGPAGPSALLQAYEGEARRHDPKFTGADASRGRTLYTSEFDRNRKTPSCTSCHTSDPRRPGKTAAGKRIAPLAPGANPEAYNDRKKADKWFDRNCKQVMGRVCSAAEKGDLLRFFMQP